MSAGQGSNRRKHLNSLTHYLPACHDPVQPQLVRLRACALCLLRMGLPVRPLPAKYSCCMAARAVILQDGKMQRRRVGVSY